MTRANAAVLGSVFLVWLSFPASGSPSISEIVQYDLAGREFFDLYAAVRSGHFDAFPQQDLLQALFGSESGFTSLQRETLVEQ
ncbi:MAG: hypothetical protein V3S41_00050, partial [Spirochaetia bacterium]